MLPFTRRPAARESSKTVATESRLSSTIATSAASAAIAVPPPSATPRSAAASAGASLVPSPTITVCPLAFSRSTVSAFPSGGTPANTDAIASCSRKTVAARSSSPVRTTTSTPESASAVTVSSHPSRALVVADHDDPPRRAVAADGDRDATHVAGRRHGLADPVGDRPPALVEQVRMSNDDLDPVDDPGDPASVTLEVGDGEGVVGLCRLCRPPSATAGDAASGSDTAPAFEVTTARVHRGDGLSDRVRRALLQRGGGEPEQVVVEVSRDHPHLAGGERPRLVEDDGVGAAEPLEDGVVEYHDRAFERVADPGGDRERSREPERTRTHETMSTVSPTSIASVTPLPSARFAAAAARSATASTTGTNTVASRSASFWTPWFPLWRSQTSSATRSRLEVASGPTSTVSEPSATTEPPTTASPGVFRTGIDSPVMTDSSTAASPATALAVDRDPLASAHEQAVAGREVVDGDLLGPASIPVPTATDDPPSAVDLYRGEIGEQLRRPLFDRVLVVVADGDDHDDRDGHVVVYRRRVDEYHGERAVGVRAHRRDRDE